MDPTRALLTRTAQLAADFLEGLDTRPVRPQATVDELRLALGGSLPEGSAAPSAVVEAMAAAAEPGVLGSASGRFFGFVIGGGLPVALAADWLTATWNQNAGLYVCGPAASVVEEVAGAWLLELLGLPADASYAFVTGCQMAHATCLAAARNAMLKRADWDVETQGLSGAPPLRVFAGAKHHVTVTRALRLLGIGTNALHLAPADSQGRLDVPALARTLGHGVSPTIICAQAGEVNTGAFDDFVALSNAAKEARAWLHVDGAFGLWAAASPSTRSLVKGIELADSWATDAHKWLNVPYDSGLAFTRHPHSHRAAMSAQAVYLMHAPEGALRDEVDWTPEFSRRARGFPVYAALRSLGRAGVAELIERGCAHAKALAAGLRAMPRCEVLNEVVLNQVLFRFEDDAATDRVVAAVQAGGEAWMSGTLWDGRRAIRLSVSNWRTSARDVERTLAAIAAAAATRG